jgi:hypothetical protein
VIFTVTQVSPDCRLVGRFGVSGHRGVNRVRFSGRVGRKVLEPGTYKITARTRRGQAVQRVTIVVVNGEAPSLSQIAAARTQNVCRATVGFTSGDSGMSGFTSGAASLPALGEPSQESHSASGATNGTNSHSGILGSAVEKTARALQPALIALLVAAILLLGVASLPRVAFVEPRFNDVLARHRGEIAGLGAVALVAVVIAFLVG